MTCFRSGGSGIPRMGGVGDCYVLAMSVCMCRFEGYGFQVVILGQV